MIFRFTLVSFIVILAIFDISLLLDQKKAIAIVPTISTSSATDVGTSTVTLVGTLSNSGTHQILNRGFVYATTSNFLSTTTVNVSTSTINYSERIYLTSFDDTPIYVYGLNGVLQHSFGTRLGNSSDYDFFIPNNDHSIDITVDNLGFIYISDYTNGGSIRKYNGDYQYVSTLGSNMGRISDLSYGPDGYLYVGLVNSAQVKVINTSGTLIRTINVSSGPDGIDFDASTNRVYVAHRIAGNIGVYNMTTGFFITSLDNGTNISIPEDVAVLGDIIYVSESTNNGSIQSYNKSNFSYIETVINNRDVSNLDAEYNLFFSDGTNNVLRDIDADISINVESPIDLDFYISGTHTGYTSQITGLTCETTYYYKAFAQNISGINYGTNQSFTTGACPSPSPDPEPETDPEPEEEDSNARAFKSTKITVSSASENIPAPIINTGLDDSDLKGNESITFYSGGEDIPLKENERLLVWKVIPLADTFKRELSFGMRGSDVRSLQTFLNTIGFILAEIGPGSKGRETEFFGNLTENSLTRYQDYFGLNATGILDINTINFMISR